MALRQGRNGGASMTGTKIFALWILFMFVDYAIGILAGPTDSLLLAAILVFSDEADKQAKSRKAVKAGLVVLVENTRYRYKKGIW